MVRPPVPPADAAIDEVEMWHVSEEIIRWWSGACRGGEGPDTASAVSAED